jgi:hypothetical protein
MIQSEINGVRACKGLSMGPLLRENRSTQCGAGMAVQTVLASVGLQCHSVLGKGLARHRPR